MKSKKIVSLAVAGAVLAGAAMPFSAQAQDPAVIRIYSSLPLTGSSAGQTTTVVNAMKLALEQQTKAGLVCDGKFKIDYVSLDDATAAAGKWDAAKEQENANKAVADADAMVYIGTFNSGAAKVSIPILNQAGMVMISPANTYEGLTKKTATTAEGDPEKYYPTGKRNYVRVVPADDIQGSVAAKWAKSLGARSVFILHDTEAYGKGVADVFRATAKTIKLTEAGYEGIDGKASELQRVGHQDQERQPWPDLLRRHHAEQRRSADQGHPQGWRQGHLHGPRRHPRGSFRSGRWRSRQRRAGHPANLPERLLPAKGKKFIADYRKIYKASPRPTRSMVMNR